MIVDRLENADRYAAVHPGFAAGFAFLREHDLLSLEAGRHEVDGDRVYVMVIRKSARGRENVKMEAHRKYIDIQYAAAGTDVIGWKPTKECTQQTAPFDPAKDVELFADAPESWTTLPPGTFAVYFPEDGHAPMCGEGDQVKVVVKVLDQWPG